MTQLTPSSSSRAAVGNFQLGDALGRGACGVVYKALNWTTGETVAVKQVRTGDIPQADVKDMMMEIDLLKNLKHANIVKYIGFVKTRDFLSIILEFCENGSLQTIYKRYGKFPDSLVAVYISQVLEGLQYLHEQGVIHRDIKGANILTTKDGAVKLADFGVATKSGALLDSAIVGSPYWMAPEVIEQSGERTTPSSDIWSVGCTVIELLEGRPPYYQCQPMQALYRMVNDEHPPLPESASPAVKDFLLHCFQKDPNLRISARKLLRHPWLASARKKLTRQDLPLQSNVPKTDQPPVTPSKTTQRSASRPVRLPSISTPSNPDRKKELKTPTGKENIQVPIFQEAVQRVKEWNEALDKDKNELPLSKPPMPQAAPWLNGADRKGSGDTKQKPGAAAAAVRANVSALQANRSPSRGLSEIDSQRHVSPLRAAVPVLGRSVLEEALLTGGKSGSSLLASTTKPEVNESDWEKDFADQVDPNKLKEVKAKQTKSEAPTRPPRRKKSLVQGETKIAGLADKTTRYAEERDSNDYSDLLSDEDGLSGLTKMMDKFHAKATINGDVDLVKKRSKTTESHAAKPAPQTASNDIPPKNGVLDKTSESFERPLFLPPATPTRPTLKSSYSTQSSAQKPGTDLGKAPGLRRSETSTQLVQYHERDEDDYNDVFGGGTSTNVQAPTISKATEPILQLRHDSNKSWPGAEDESYDPFRDLEGDSLNETDDDEAIIARDHLVAERARIDALIELLLDSKQSQQAQKEAAFEIYNRLTEEKTGREMQIRFVQGHGMLPIINLLESTQSRDVILALLRIINLTVQQDLDLQESLCLTGAIPAIMTLASKKQTKEIRLEAALFIAQMCQSSVLTLQMFISCRGLKTLVEFLDEDYNDQKDLVWIAVDGIWSVFGLQSATPRNDFCRVLVRDGLLEPLTATMGMVLKDVDTAAEVCLDKIIGILLVFSQSDPPVKKFMTTRGVLRRISKALELVKGEQLLALLKTVKNITMLGQALETLQNANIIENLVDIMTKHGKSLSNQHNIQITNQALTALFNLCQLNKSRSEEAVAAGIIPCLKIIVTAASPMRQFALPLMCDFAHCGPFTRKALWQNGGVSFFISLLSDRYWQVKALDALIFWLQEEGARVEDALNDQKAALSLKAMFTSSSNNSFEALLEPLARIVRLCPSLCEALADGDVVQKIVLHLRNKKKNDNMTKLKLLRLLKTMCDEHPRPIEFVESNQLRARVELIANEDPAVLVQQLAREILSQSYFTGQKTSENNGGIQTHTALSSIHSNSSSASMGPPHATPKPKHAKKLSDSSVEGETKSKTGAHSSQKIVGDAKSNLLRALEIDDKAVGQMLPPKSPYQSPDKSQFRAIPHLRR